MENALELEYNEDVTRQEVDPYWIGDGQKSVPREVKRFE